MDTSSLKTREIKAVVVSLWLQVVVSALLLRQGGIFLFLKADNGMVEHETLDLRAVSLSPTLNVEIT